MSQRITIDPITRIEGHLRIDCEVEGGKVSKAWSTGHHVARHRDHPPRARPARGLDLHPAHLRRVHHRPRHRLGARRGERPRPRDPASTRSTSATSSSLAHALHDHIVHFYQLSALDWVDVDPALKADPAKAASDRGDHLSLAAQRQGRDGGGEGQGEGVRGGRPARHLLQRLLGPPGDEPPARGEPHRRRPLPPGARLPAQGAAGGRDPRVEDPQHPEPGGGRRRQRHQPRQPVHPQHGQAVPGEGRSSTRWWPSSTRSTSPTSAPSARMYPEWLGHGAGVTNYLAVPDLPLDTKGTKFDLPGGTIMAGDLKSTEADRLVPATTTSRRT